MTTAPSLTKGGLTVERTGEAIVAWRSWALSGTQGGEDLLLLPVAKHSRPWIPREVAQAVCRRHRAHVAPELDCLCGLHASQTFDIVRRTRCPAVLGRVALWGRVIEHERGYRARYAYPQRLRLICQFCFWQHGPFVAAPSVVGWYAHDRLVPLCPTHLVLARAIGLGPRALLDAGEVDQRLRGAYAVDPLPV